MSDFASQVRELNNLDMSNPGDWPMLAKALASALVIAVLSFFGIYYWVFDLQDQLVQVQGKETELRQEFESKQAKAANLEDYRKQMAVMQESFGALLRQLPKSTEVPGLVDDITFAGTGSGLKFNQIKLEKERKAEFYTEQPISIEVTGSYHQFGEFVSKISGLPRIVTVHDFTLASPASTKDDMVFRATAKTYRYDSEEGK
ncbi:MAG: type 4a pilus biogenesis protein PilO [Gammaproteobacteria bacterium]|nr:type 4a pilus biogenesis protein PilO [Gammaproteobacteria bacterium]